MCTNNYDEAIIAQGALPILFDMLLIVSPLHNIYCRRIRYKAAICIQLLAAKSYGLKAIYQCKGYQLLLC
jgi:hypothetical protein